MWPDFTFILSLKEKVSGHEVSKGYFTGYRYSPGGPLDEPIRIVCRGEHGFAVLHMTTFGTAVQATVSVALVIENDIGGNLPTIHGKLVARYEEEEYKNDIHRKYFQTRLFSVPEDVPKELLEARECEGPERSKQFKIPLSRSVIAVPASGHYSPEDWLLVFKTDLGINYPGTQLTASKVKGTILFAGGGDEPEPSILHIDLDHNYGYIEVKVSWKTSIVRDAFSVRPDFDPCFSLPP